MSQLQHEVENIAELSRKVDIRDIKFFTKYADKGPDTAPVPEDWVSWTVYTENGRSVTNTKVKHIAPNRKSQSGAVEWAIVKPHYEAWKAGREAPLDGTPIEVFAGFERSDIDYLQRDFRVRTLEQLVNMKDGQISRCVIPGIRERIRRAQAYLDSKRDAGGLQREFAERDNQLTLQRDQLAQQSELIEEMRKQLAMLAGDKVPDEDEPTDEPKKRGPGRPRKDEAVAA